VILDIQPIPARGSWSRQVDAVLAAEEAGFGTVWAVDHLAGSAFEGDGMIECFTQLGWLAAVTSTIGLGSLVLNVNNRSAGLLGTAIASIQDVSGGRFVLGLGAGASRRSPYGAEQLAIGNPPAERIADRHQHVLDTLDALDRQWSAAPGPPFEGFPRPEPRPPTLLGVNSRRLAALAGARTDGVNVRWNHPDRAGILATAVEARGQRDGWWTTSVWTPWDVELARADHALRRELEAEGVDRLIVMWVDPPPLEEIAAAGAELRRAG
jgi:alkanesulfonate monooxygenase SsuD/methylene tetrahydromethanopterin reductase-like flavin-dependent oxidoreductase (luciferase family)